MRFAAYISLLSLLGLAAADAVPWERLDKDNSLLLVVDLQVGLYRVVRDWNPTVFRQNMIAHAAIGKLFNLPTILTTSQEQGPNGPLPKQIQNMYNSTRVIKRQGEVNAWDNAEFRDAVRAANKTQIIMAGITTDVCTAFLALSLRAEGYSVWANVEASGTTSTLIRDVSNARMQAAGVQVVSLLSILTELMRDTRNTPGSKEVIPWLNEYYPSYTSMLAGF